MNDACGMWYEVGAVGLMGFDAHLCILFPRVESKARLDSDMTNKSEDIAHILSGDVSDSEEDTVFFEDLDEDNPKKEIRPPPNMFIAQPHDVDAEAPLASMSDRKNGSRAPPEFPGGVDPKKKTTLTPDSPKGHSTLIIEHTMPSSNLSGSAFLFGMSKPVFAMVAFALLFTTTSAIVFFTHFLRIPGLDNQIEALTEQVDQLEAQIEELQFEIDRLSSEVDRLESEVDTLSAENDRLEAQNDRLETANDAFEELYQSLNGTNAGIFELLQSLSNTSDNLLLQVAGLTIENENLKNSTEALEYQVSDLGVQVQILNTTKTGLNATIQALETENDELRAGIVALNETNADLTSQNVDLANATATLNIENSELSDQIVRLETVLGYLNGTVASGDFEEATQTLYNLIEANRNLALVSLKNQYMSRIDFWLCDFQLSFEGKFFLADPNSTIGESEYPAVSSHIDSRAMTPLCLNISNFEDFVNVIFIGSEVGLSPPYNATTNQLRSAVEQYTTQALNFYFPNEDEGGISAQNWTQAGYECEGFPAGLKFAIDFN